MKLSIKKGKRNLQEIYSTITNAYTTGTLDEMKRMSNEFVIEMRVEKYKGRGFINTIEKIKDKTKLLTFITNLHMQDSKETAGLSRI
jgi:hypothetical protein|tara:strand:- start:253 stop:513 length:261 start_codon:yes stop_codon:yes gene_type:complete